MIPYSKPKIDEADVEHVSAVLRTGMIASGATSKLFEQSFVETVGAKYGVTFSSCTAALFAALRYHGIDAGDAVVVPSLTFTGTAEAVLLNGADVVLADIDPTTLSLTAANLQQAVETFRTKSDRAVRAAIVVHYAGQIADVEAISAYCRQQDIRLIHDCAHCLEAEFLGADRRWRRIGQLDDICCFSLYPTKCITTGLGGVLTSNDEKIADWCRRFANHGIVHPPGTPRWNYDVASAGFNLCMSDILAALGVAQLKKSAELYARRRYLAARYDNALGGSPALDPLGERSDRRSDFHMYVVRLRDRRLSRATLLHEMKREGVILSVHWRPLHLHSSYLELAKRGRCFIGDLRHCNEIWPTIFSLPCYPAMTDNEQDTVISTLKQILM